MPCRSDYMEPTAFEKESQYVAKLIVYVNEQLGAKTQPWIKQCAKNMYGAPSGCQGGDPALVPYLCELLKKMESEKLNALVYNPHKKKSRQLADWWEQHQKNDRKRERAEARRKEDEIIRQAALEKLTFEERRVLGV